MDDGRDRHARHVRGLVAASDILARPGLSARGRLRRLADVADAAIAGHRTALFVAEEGGSFRAQHRIGPALPPEDELEEEALLHDPTVLERLVAREVVVLADGAQPHGRGVLVLAPMALEGEVWGCLSVEGTPDGQRADDLTRDTLVGLANMGAHVLLAERLRTDRAEVLSRDLLTEQRNRRRISNRRRRHPRPRPDHEHRRRRHPGDARAHLAGGRRPAPGQRARARHPAGPHRALPTLRQGRTSPDA